MKIISTTKRILRGDVNTRTVALEAMRRVRVMNARRTEQAQLAELNQQPARLREEFARVRAADLLAHFRSRTRPNFLPGFQNPGLTAELQNRLFPKETALLIKQAERIVKDHCWPVLGFGEKCFGAEKIQWNRDPLSGVDWPLDYHASINLVRNDGSDARVLWEVNRCAHFISLGRVYALTNDDRISEEFFRQLASWREQNPVARGVNWNCAMEVALRAMNLLASFALFLHAPQMDEMALKEFLQMLDQHGAHIQRNLEFSHVATSNHYLADVVGLLWIGLMLPELEAAREWRDFGLREVLNEMDKQLLADGADYEASTGYHRLKIELFLYSFVLCHLNGLDIPEAYWNKLRAMIDYLRAYVRPDGRAPLIGDSDSGQVLPIVTRAGNDHAYLLALGAAVFQEPQFKIGAQASGLLQSGAQGSVLLPAAGVRNPDVRTEELLWILGEQGMRDYDALPAGEAGPSKAFPDAGVYILRDQDLYLLFNAGGIGVNGRGSHGHNDALSLEISACGTAFIVDPGSYLYTADLHERHLFRSTAYHSTVQVDQAEQNSLEMSVPFMIGNEAQPKVLNWETTADADLIVAEHYGYQRLARPVLHRRTVRFDKRQRFWLVEDEMTGEGTHDFTLRFHFAPGLETKVCPDGAVELCDKITGARLFIAALNDDCRPELESGFVSTDYGAKRASVIACWSGPASAPVLKRCLIIPLRPNDHQDLAAELIVKLRAEAAQKK